MVSKFILDSDVIIWHLRGHEPTEGLLRELEPEQPLSCSTISIFEVWSGVRPEDEESTRRFLSVLYQIPVDGDIALKAAEYWREFRGQGITLGQADVLIAATAHVSKSVLVTYNSSHYPMKDITFYRPMPQLE